MSLYKEQIEEASEWASKHDETHGPNRNIGAIGGAYTWKFTSTSIGIVTKYGCACGEEIDVSDYDQW